jgi:hypothetical protein
MSEVSIFSVDTLIKYMGNDDKARAMVGKIVADACAPPWSLCCWLARRSARVA